MTTIILGVTGDVLSLFNKIPFMIHLFLLVLFKLECEAVVLSVSLFDNYIHTAFCHSCSAITLFDISRSWTGCSLMRPSLNCGEDGRELHRYTFPVTPNIRCIGEVMNRAERWYVYSLGTFCKCMLQFFQCLNVKSGGDLSPPGSRSTSTSLSKPEDSFHNFTGWGNYSGLLLCQPLYFTSLILSQSGGTHFLHQSWYSGSRPLAYRGSACEPSL